MKKVLLVALAALSLGFGFSSAKAEDLDAKGQQVTINVWPANPASHGMNASQLKRAKILQDQNPGNLDKLISSSHLSSGTHHTVHTVYRSGGASAPRVIIHEATQQVDRATPYDDSAIRASVGQANSQARQAVDTSGKALVAARSAAAEANRADEDATEAHNIAEGSQRLSYDNKKRLDAHDTDLKGIRSDLSNQSNKIDENKKKSDDNYSKLFSVLYWIVGLTVGLMLLGAVVQLFSNLSQNKKSDRRHEDHNDFIGAVNELARAAMEQILALTGRVDAHDARIDALERRVNNHRIFSNKL